MRKRRPTGLNLPAAGRYNAAMAHPMSDFLEKLLAAGQLARVAVEVDPHLEAAELTRRVATENGPALLLDRVQGQKSPLATNLFGTPERLCLALGIDHLDELAARLDRLTQSTSQNWLQRLRSTTEPAAHEKYQPRVVKSGQCQQVVRLGRDIQLQDLPAIQCWPQETGRTLSAALAITVDPVTKVRSASLCRLQVIGNDRVAIVDDGTSALARAAEAAATANERLPVAFMLGDDPTFLLAGALPLRLDVDGLLLCGLLRDRPLALVKARTQPLDVPADADLIIEGFIEAPGALVEAPTNPLNRGPNAAEPRTLTIVAAGLGNGHYGQPQAALCVQLTALTQRSNPIVPSLVYGQPYGDLATLQFAIERMLFPHVRGAVRELVDFSLPAVGGQHGFAVLAIQKSAPHQARKVASAVWGLDFLASTKCVVIVDAQVDVHDAASVLAEIAANVHPARDVFFHQGPGDPCDHAAPTSGLGHAMGIDATRKLPGEHPTSWPQRLASDANVAQLVQSRWAEYGLTGKTR
jgi:4-hydroxy-3-polyprenylbenzoate decarboxylase